MSHTAHSINVNPGLIPPSLVSGTKQEVVPSQLVSRDVAGGTQYVTMLHSDYVDLKWRAQAWDSFVSNCPSDVPDRLPPVQEGATTSVRRSRRVAPHLRGAAPRTKIACSECHAARRACDVVRPCYQCQKKGLSCTPRSPTKSRSASTVAVAPSGGCGAVGEPPEVQGPVAAVADNGEQGPCHGTASAIVGGFDPTQFWPYQPFDMHGGMIGAPSAATAPTAWSGMQYAVDA